MRLLDDGNATRLYRALSDERGLCYDVGVVYEPYANSGVIEVVAECAHASTPQVLDETVRVLRDLSEAGPTAAELTRAKARLRWQMLELNDMPAELAAFVGQAVLSGTPATPAARSAELLAVDAERLRQAAQRIFRAARSSLVVIGKLSRAARNHLQAAQRSLGG